MRKSKREKVLAEALRCVERGFLVFLLRPKSRASYRTAAETGTSWGATRDPAVLEADLQRWPRANLGVVTGRVSGIFVTDEDTLAGGHRADGIATMAELERVHGALPRTLTAISPSGSRHRYFRYPAGKTIRNSAGRLGPGVDVRGDGGMVLAPPSAKGEVEYRWEDEGAEIAEAPDWLVELAEDEERDGGAEGEPTWQNRAPVDDAELAAAVAAIPNDDGVGWEDWNRVGMAIWRATEGSDAGLILFDDWSRKAAGKYSAEDTREKWDLYERTPPDRIGVGTVLYLADRADPSWRKAQMAREALRQDEPPEIIADVRVAAKKRDEGGDRLIGGSPEEDDEGSARPDRVRLKLSDFWAHLPDAKFILAATGDMWLMTAVDRTFGKVPVLDARGRQKIDEESGKPLQVAASTWLMQNRAVHQILWSPADDRIVRDRYLINGGWLHKSGAAAYNTYRPPRPMEGDGGAAGPWLDHVRKLYPQDWEHLVRWMAHRVQRPGEKVNHSIVLLGNQGIGKDMMLEPLRRAVGSWNFEDVTPHAILGDWSGYVKSVVLRINESRDLGDVNRYQFYERTKILMAAPPDVLIANAKYQPLVHVQNCCGVIVTTNRKDSLYLPEDDRRHFVAYSELSRDDHPAGYFIDLWRWYGEGGYGHVAAHLRELDISAFDAKEPPPQTQAFAEIVDSSVSGETRELEGVVGLMGNPEALTTRMVSDFCSRNPALLSVYEWLGDRRNRRSIFRVMEEVGYSMVRNPTEKRGRWLVDGVQIIVYARSDLGPRDRHAVAQALSLRGEANVTPIPRGPAGTPPTGSGRGPGRR